MKNSAIAALVQNQYNLDPEVQIRVNFTHSKTTNGSTSHYFYDVEWWESDEHGNDICCKTTIEIGYTSLSTKLY